MGSPPEVQPADPNSRRHALMALVVVVGLAIIVRHELGILLADIEAQSVADPEGAMQRMGALLGVFAVLLSTGLLVLATVVAWIGRRTAVAERFPPPGMPVVSNTRVRAGAAARSLAHGAYAAAAFFVVAAFVVFRQVRQLIEALSP